MPGKSLSPACSFRTRLSRISCLTGRDCTPDRRKSPRVSIGAAMNRFYPRPDSAYRQRARKRAVAGLHYVAVVASFLYRSPAAGVRAPRRERARAGEHHRGLRPRPGARRGRAGARRAPVARRRGRRPPRPDARADHEPDRAGREPDRRRTGACRRRILVSGVRLRRATAPPSRRGGRILQDPDGGDFPFRGRGVNIPTLAAVLERYRDVPIVVELKVNRAEMARAVVEVVRRADAVDRVCLGSFGWRVLREARRLEPAMATSAAREEVRWALYRSWCRWPVDARQLQRVSGAGMVGPDARRFAKICRGLTRGGSRRAGVDGRRRSGRGPSAGLGR